MALIDPMFDFFPVGGSVRRERSGVQLVASGQTFQSAAGRNLPAGAA